MKSYTEYEPLAEYVIRAADNTLILGHRLSELCGHGPVLEQDIAITNMALDLLGQSRMYLQYAAELIGGEETEDTLAFHRDGMQFRNCQLVELPNGDFAHTIFRQFIFDSWHFFFVDALTRSKDNRLRDIAEKSIKEVAYHRKFSSEWTIRLGDGTEESKKRMEKAIDSLWGYSGELTLVDELDQSMAEKGVGVDLNQVKSLSDEYRSQILERAGLQLPGETFMYSGGKKGIHTEHHGFILAEMQHVQRTYPGQKW
ncbi:MAG: phenylacetate-CoA oxygenase subunit PaaI [Saprospirales bacterium]|nr:MAG: phenylacetate-CoA oxygenase subunit PaaI [Saprospirales bacterium]